MDFNQLSQPELDEIVNEINSKPKKVLQYKTANEAFTEELGGAIQSRM
jgi:IS30 family transposase